MALCHLVGSSLLHIRAFFLFSQAKGEFLLQDCLPQPRCPYSLINKNLISFFFLMMILDPLLNLARDYEHLNIPGKEWQAEEETEVCSDFFFL